MQAAKGYLCYGHYYAHVSPKTYNPGTYNALHQRKMLLYNKQLQWVAEPGEFEIMVGTSSGNLPIKNTLTIED